MKRATDLFTIAALALLLVGLTTTPVAGKKLSDTFIRIEINDTDGDAGIHVFLDGEGWDTMQMTNPNGEVQFMIAGEGSVAMQGITEFFFESAEPSFDVQTLDELLDLFPEGVYRFAGTTKEGKRLKGRARLTHAIPAGPMQISPFDGEDVDPDDAVFTWGAVPDPPGGEIVGYEVIVVCEDLDFGEMALQVGSDVTSVTVPPEFLNQGGEECKWEVLAIDRNGNQTISETEFSID